MLLSPFFAVIAAWIKLDSRGPVLFRQVRMGEGGRTFRVFKFRTMVENAESLKTEVAHLNMTALSRVMAATVALLGGLG